jgi:hypothetical protein
MTEIFFEKELADISFDVEKLDEWKELAAQLGMDSQLALSKGDKSPIPYPYMNDNMFRVYDTLCPSHKEFRQYNNTTIPLDVMKQIAFSVKENHFHSIQVWADDKEPDPFVIGIICKFFNWDVKDEKGNRIHFDTKEECLNHPDNIKKEVSETDKKHYLIARWGDELKSFKELKQKALDRLIEKYTSELQREIKEKTTKLNSITENCACYLNGSISLYEVR